VLNDTRSRVEFPMRYLLFFLTQSFRPHHGLGVESASDTSEYQRYLLAASGYSGQHVRLTTLPTFFKFWELLTPTAVRDVSWPVQGLLLHMGNDSLLWALK
jgi:hypothetical protein